MFDAPDSLVPLLGAGSATGSGFIMGRLIAWNATTRENTVEVPSQHWANLPVLASAVDSLINPCTVLLIPFGPRQIIAGRIIVP
jgi:hypothetical protein